ncbi:MAG: hypothetical protein WHX52_23200 [Anaerolineae bacterium]
MERTITFIVLLGLFIAGCISQPNIVMIQGTDYEMDCYLPMHWENRLDSWDEWLLPPEGKRFIWVYCVIKSIVAEPVELYRDDFQLSYRVEGTERYTTTLVATGNNDIYGWAPKRDIIHGGPRNYGGVTDVKGFGQRYVFGVPKNAQDFVLEIKSMPSLPLSVRE